MLCVFLEHIPSPLFAGMLMHDVGFDTHLVMSQKINLYANLPKLFDDIFAHSIVNSYHDNMTKPNLVLWIQYIWISGHIIAVELSSSMYVFLTNRATTNKHLPHTYINLINVVYLLEDSEKFILAFLSDSKMMYLWRKWSLRCL